MFVLFLYVEISRFMKLSLGSWEILEIWTFLLYVDPRSDPV